MTADVHISIQVPAFQIWCACTCNFYVQLLHGCTIYSPTNIQMHFIGFNSFRFFHFLKFILFYVSKSFARIYRCTPYACLVPMEVGRKYEIKIPWNWSSIGLWVKN